MAFTLYDATVKTYLQILGGARGVLEKGRSFAEASGLDLAEVVGARLAPDMLPFSVQIILINVHSRQALDGAQQGASQGPQIHEYDYAGLQALLAEAEAGVAAWTPEAVNALVGKEMTVRMGQTQLSMTADEYLLGFALPNFYFHVTTAYDILRNLGAPVGKRDFMGQLPLRQPA
jgi:hypothetical protein